MSMKKDVLVGHSFGANGSLLFVWTVTSQRSPKKDITCPMFLDISLRSHFSGVGVVFFSDSWSTQRTTLSTDGNDMTLGLQRLVLLH